MTAGAQELRSGKGHRDENFPVASRLIHPRHRGAILAFYNFVRTADDIAEAVLLAEVDLIGSREARHGNPFNQPLGDRRTDVYRSGDFTPEPARPAGDPV